jgi:two-component system, OmpR family, response regulator
MMTTEALTHILYVEDDADIRSVASFALEEIGNFTIAACESGAEALRRAESFRPQLLLLDVMMPGMDGPTVFSRMRANTERPNCPVIFVTAKALPREIALFRELGAVGVIAKPFDPMELGRQVLQIWERPNDQ